jgi:hypothetical protein
VGCRADRRAQQPADTSLAGHAAALALNRPGVDFTIALQSGRTSFNPREPIVIELRFDLESGLGVLGVMPKTDVAAGRWLTS